MRTLILTSLLTGGLLFGASSDSTPKKVSGNERVALETQSPKVHISKKAEKNGTADKVVARRIVADFHGPNEADAAREAFNLEVRQGREPNDIETVELPAQAGTPDKIRLDKLLATTGLAPSVTEASRRIKAGAVEVNGAIFKDLTLEGAFASDAALVVRSGKLWKRITVSKA